MIPLPFGCALLLLKWLFNLTGGMVKDWIEDCCSLCLLLLDLLAFIFAILHMFGFASTSTQGKGYGLTWNGLICDEPNVVIAEECGWQR